MAQDIDKLSQQISKMLEAEFLGVNVRKLVDFLLECARGDFCFEKYKDGIDDLICAAQGAEFDSDQKEQVDLAVACATESLRDNFPENMLFAVLVQKLLPFVSSAESRALKRDLDGIIVAWTLKGTTTEYCGLANICEQRIEKDADFDLVKRIIRQRLVVDELTTSGWKTDCGGIDDCITECDELLREVSTSALDAETRKATQTCEKHRPKARGGDDGTCWYVTESDETTLEQLLGIAKSTLLAVPLAEYQKDADAVLAARIGMQGVGHVWEPDRRELYQVVV